MIRSFAVAAAMSNPVVREPYEFVGKVLIKEECRVRGLGVGGSKEFLMMRLRAFDASRRSIVGLAEAAHDSVEAAHDSEADEAEESETSNDRDSEAAHDSEAASMLAHENTQADEAENDEAAVTAMQKQRLDEEIVAESKRGDEWSSACNLNRLTECEERVRNLKRARKGLDTEPERPVVAKVKLNVKMQELKAFPVRNGSARRWELSKLYTVHLTDTHKISEAYIGNIRRKNSLQNLCHMLDNEVISRAQLMEVIDHCSICMEENCRHCGLHNFAGHQAVTELIDDVLSPLSCRGHLFD